jgi:hypothetical protein
MQGLPIDRTPSIAAIGSRGATGVSELAGRLVVRYELSVRPSDVGSRVSLRLRLPSGGLTDVVGRLEAWESDLLHVRKRDGTVVTVRADALVAGKVVPSGPTRRRTSSS